jgi:hypothetical protein
MKSACGSELREGRGVPSASGEVHEIHAEANITPTVLVTLQKGPSIAVCTFGAPFWELIGTAKNDPLHTPERCDVT